MTLYEWHGINTKQPSSGVLCVNITLFGVVEDPLHHAGSVDPPPILRHPKLSDIATQHTRLW